MHYDIRLGFPAVLKHMMPIEYLVRPWSVPLGSQVRKVVKDLL